MNEALRDDGPNTLANLRPIIARHGNQGDVALATFEINTSTTRGPINSRCLLVLDL